MGIDFGALIIDLEELVSNSKEDFINEFWSSYQTYVKTYNKLLADIQSLGFYKKLKPIKSVPFSEQSFESGYSKEEKAKLREVNNSSKTLLRKVKLLLAPPIVPSFNHKIRSTKIFIINGEENEIYLDVVNKLQQLELNPIIFDEKLDLENSFFEAIIKNPHISFAIFIFSTGNLIPSKMQDLIFKLGFFIGKLGVENVVAIYEEDNEFKIPKHSQKVLWIEYKSNWYFKLIKQLQICNFDVDANKIDWL